MAIKFREKKHNCLSEVKEFGPYEILRKKRKICFIYGAGKFAPGIDIYLS